MLCHRFWKENLQEIHHGLKSKGMNISRSPVNLTLLEILTWENFDSVTGRWNVWNPKVNKL